MGLGLSDVQPPRTRMFLHFFMHQNGWMRKSLSCCFLHFNIWHPKYEPALADPACWECPNCGWYLAPPNPPSESIWRSRTTVREVDLSVVTGQRWRACMSGRRKAFIKNDSLELTQVTTHLQHHHRYQLSSPSPWRIPLPPHQDSSRNRFALISRIHPATTAGCVAFRLGPKSTGPLLPLLEQTDHWFLCPDH